MNIKLIILWKILFLIACSLACTDYDPQTYTQYNCNPQTLTTRKQDRQNYQPVKTSANPQTTIPQTTTPASSQYFNPFYAFSTKLFSVVAPDNAQRNIVFSPLSLHTLLGLLYMSSEGPVSQQLREVLEMTGTLGEVAGLFQGVQQHLRQQSAADLQLHMANKLYYNNNLRLNREFYNQLKPYFDAEIEATLFANPDYAAAQINAWVAGKTNQRIQQIVTPSSLDRDTSAILINAIYLKAKWAKQFSTYDTQPYDFYVKNKRSVPVDMMYIEDEMPYAELPSLNARAIELNFDRSDLSMVFILPNEIEGLQQLELLLANTDLNAVIRGLRNEKVTLRLPKFVYEFNMDATTPLKRLGLQNLFNEYANFTGFFDRQSVKISQIQHKAYINVNEGGVEAAAVSFAKLIPLALPAQMNYFTIDHPFVYIIRSPYAVYFMGHVVKP